MGQAKRRGTYEQRRAEGEARVAKELLIQYEEDLARERAMTPEEKEKRTQARTMLSMLYGLSGMGSI